jgi:hypothetical protein
MSIRLTRIACTIFLASLLLASTGPSDFTAALAQTPTSPPPSPGSPPGFLQWGSPKGFDSSQYPGTLRTEARHVIYVLAAAGDIPTQQKLIGEFIAQMESKGPFIQYSRLVAVPGWSPSDFASACANDSAHTAGAFVITLVSTSAYSTGALVLRTNVGTLVAQALFAGCFAPPLPTAAPLFSARSEKDPVHPAGYSGDLTVARGKMSINLSVVTPAPPAPTPAPSATPAAAYLWASGPVSDAQHVTEVQVGTALAYLLMLGGIEASLFPSRTVSSMATQSFPSPLPFDRPYTSSIVTGNSTTTNVAQYNSFNAIAATGFTANSQFITLPTADWVSNKLVQSAISRLSYAMRCNKLDRSTPAPSPPAVDEPLPYCANEQR